MSDAKTLFDAVTAGDAAAAQQIADAAPDLLETRDAQGATPILKALYHGKPEIAKALAAIKPAINLFEAAALGDADRVRELLESDKTLIDAIAPDGFPLISLAAFFGRDAIVGELIERGANVNVVSTNGMNLCPIHAAAARNDENMMRKLLEAGANPDVQQQGGWTALHSAAKHGSRPLLDLLVKHGADKSIKSSDGKTAKVMAIDAGHADVAKQL